MPEAAEDTTPYPTLCLSLSHSLSLVQALGHAMGFHSSENGSFTKWKTGYYSYAKNSHTVFDKVRSNFGHHCRLNISYLFEDILYARQQALEAYYLKGLHVCA